MSSSNNVTHRRIVRTKNAPTSNLPFNQAVIADKTMYLAGQIGADPKTGELVPGGVQEQTRQALANIGEVLKAGGASFNSVVKVTVLLKDISDFQAMNEVYKTFFVPPFEPARAAYQVAALPRGAAVEVEAVAVVGDIVDV